MTNGAYIRFRATKMLQTGQGPKLLDISFNLDKGKLLTLYGPSGAGKTTILRILAGLTNVSSGYIEVGDRIWCDMERKLSVPPNKRSVGFVFQDFGLFPHLSVLRQLEFALPKGEDNRLILELLELMELGPLQHSRPIALSGGQQQRVALARAIARRPDILLLDEPLSALDDEMRYRLQDYIGKAHRHFGLTTILVSHHLPEIFRLSDEVISIDNGNILRHGSPSAVLLTPNISGKFKMTGEIITITPADIVFVVTVRCAGAIVQVIATAEEARTLHAGQRVMVASKAFNPVIIPF